MMNNKTGSGLTHTKTVINHLIAAIICYLLFAICYLLFAFVLFCCSLYLAGLILAHGEMHEKSYNI